MQQDSAAIRCANWLKSLPERFNLQPKPEWSEDDKEILLSIKCVIDDIWHIKNNTIDCPNDELEEMWRWLNTLYERVEFPQPHWKPSEEQMEALNEVANNGVLLDLFNDLKKLL